MIRNILRDFASFRVHRVFPEQKCVVLSQVVGGGKVKYHLFDWLVAKLVLSDSVTEIIFESNKDRFVGLVLLSNIPMIQDYVVKRSNQTGFSIKLSLKISNFKIPLCNPKFKNHFETGNRRIITRFVVVKASVPVISIFYKKPSCMMPRTAPEPALPLRQVFRPLNRQQDLSVKIRENRIKIKQNVFENVPVVKHTREKVAIKPDEKPSVPKNISRRASMHPIRSKSNNGRAIHAPVAVCKNKAVSPVNASVRSDMRQFDAPTEKSVAHKRSCEMIAVPALIKQPAVTVKIIANPADSEKIVPTLIKPETIVRLPMTRQAEQVPVFKKSMMPEKPCVEKDDFVPIELDVNVKAKSPPPKMAIYDTRSAIDTKQSQQIARIRPEIKKYDDVPVKQDEENKTADRPARIQPQQPIDPIMPLPETQMPRGNIKSSVVMQMVMNFNFLAMTQPVAQPLVIQKPQLQNKEQNSGQTKSQKIQYLKEKVQKFFAKHFQDGASPGVNLDMADLAMIYNEAVQFLGYKHAPCVRKSERETPRQKAARIRNNNGVPRFKIGNGMAMLIFPGMPALNYSCAIPRMDAHGNPTRAFTAYLPNVKESGTGMTFSENADIGQNNQQGVNPRMENRSANALARFVHHRAVNHSTSFNMSKNRGRCA